MKRNNKNDITGDRMVSKPSNLYASNFDNVFGNSEQLKKERELDQKITHYIMLGLFILCAGSITYDLNSTELVHKFGSPSFSGINQSANYLTIDEQERTRKEKIRADAQEALEEAQREAENTTLAKFLRNLESRIYSTLAKDISESLFDYGNPASGENPIFGEIELEGNIIQWLNDGTTITLTIIEMADGVEISRTTITIPVGSFGGCVTDCG